MTEKLRDLLLSMIKSALMGFDSTIESSEKVLSQGLTVWDDILKLADVLKPFCYTIIAICLLIEIAQVASKVDLIKWEHGLKLGVKMVLSKVCIDIAPDFLKACYLQASSWITSAASVSLGGTVKLGELANTDMQELLKKVSGLGSVLGLFASLMIIIIAIKICGLLIQVMAYGRIFELYVYLAVSPFPCAFFPLGDGSGSGVSRITSRYFKSFIAVCLQGVMMMICLRLFGVIIGDAFTTIIADALAANNEAAVAVSDLCYTMLLGAIVLVMSVTKCGSWAKSIIDAM